MIFDTGKKKYKIIREVFLGEVNDVYVCENLQSRLMEYKTVWVVKERTLAKQLLQEFEKSHQQKGLMYEECFHVNEKLCFIFPYEQERPLHKFYLSVVKQNHCSSQKIWQDFVTQCMTSGIPDGIMNLILKQKQIRIEPDGSIAFQFLLDLSEYRGHVDTKENVILCARQLVELIEQEQKTETEITGRLLLRKLQRGEYKEFIQLYKDIKLSAHAGDKPSRKERLQKGIKAEKDNIYRILSMVSITLLVIVLIMLIFRLVFGDFAFYRLFHISLRQIGTESLLQ